MCFELESDGLAWMDGLESTPIMACMLEPRFKHLQILWEKTRVEATWLIWCNKTEESYSPSIHPPANLPISAWACTLPAKRRCSQLSKRHNMHPTYPSVRA
ncbi:hypothetical protein AAFF_G00414660 [Aldrovandia affinis]|uniref:Uncharacterized protein n=1 Tax=Aldrovandia affinis TaxID=143900 RepID=A0AAD7WJD2_9TELE|nr:hypothetical protein AAFF_G00414660 [Aldrovandia affinis]